MTTAICEHPQTRRIEMMPGGQSGFFFSKAKHPGLFGGVGACKTFTGLHKTVDIAERYPGARLLISEPTARMVKDVLLPSIRQEFGSLEGWGWELHGSPGDYDIHWHNGSILMLRSALLMSPDMLSGLFLAAFWMDEVALGDQERTFRVLQERLRQPGEFPYQGFVTGTPRGMNWAYRLWGPERKKGFEPFHVRTDENPHLPVGYVESLRESFGDTTFARQELGGEFVAFMGLIYPQFSTGVGGHVQEPPESTEFTRRVAGVDFSGGTSPSVIEVYGKLPSRKVCGLGEFYLPACPVDRLVAAAGELMTEHRISMFFCDPSGAEEIEQMRKAGLPVAPAPVKDVNLGIKLVSSLLSNHALTFCSQQVHQIAEMYQYQWKEQRSTGEFLDEPLKQGDHCSDATRYALTALVEPPASRPRIGTAGIRV